ncbi:Fucolectin-4 Precursor [Triplophysa tibetana]|uniref:Fucolectin-4 n=1 Tax=Triplophysa tibetana TaxID=1572043 RepID=A0A5A9PSM6_9TELE|nr:Fucolectin-4 Precursor [Triplophysa tibetana]
MPYPVSTHFPVQRPLQKITQDRCKKHPQMIWENLALNGRTTQSSTYSTWAAQNAIDGERYGQSDSTHCTSTSYESNPWWRLDLLDIYEIKTVIITARSDGHLAEASGAEIRIGNLLENNGNNNPICAVTSDLVAGNTNTYSCGVMEGRYVNVVMTGHTTNLSLCEVEVYETENLALNGSATQSATHADWIAQRAIDGFRYDKAPYCSSGSNTNPWWRLDLLKVYNISKVIITAHKFDEVSGAEIRIGNSLENNGNNNLICAVTPNPLPGRTITYSCGVMVGRYVNLILPGRTGYLALCELEVYGTENLALRGTATQSSIRPAWFSQKAIDGLRYGPDPDTGSYCSATTSESNPWWSLDLLNNYDVNTVIITAHNSYLQAASEAEIRVGNSLENNGNNNTICAVTTGLLNGQTVSYSCHGMDGRYVNVVISGSTSQLTLCEVEVYGAVHRRKTFLRLKFSSSGDVAAESDEILHQLQSVLGSHISDFKLSWTQLPKKGEEQEEDGGEYTQFI